MALSNAPKMVVANPGKNPYLFPFVLVTSLFFLWGLAYGLLDVLNKHFQEAMSIDKSRSTLLQMAYFGAYFLVALPAGMFMKRFGYKRGIILGLLMYALGAFLFFPAAELRSFNFFLMALFILAAGLTCLETAANPYATVLGKPETAAFRLNLSQCFNGMGSFIGPIIAANYFFSDSNTNGGDLGSVQIVYLVIAAVVLLVAFLFVKTPLPEIKEEVQQHLKTTGKKLFSHTHFTAAIITQFFYVAAQVGIAALFINYCTEAEASITSSKASYLLSGSLLIFTIGRFAGTALMRKISPEKLLLVYALINIALCVVVIAMQNWVSIYSLMAIFFFESIMFPTIFALGIKNLGAHTKQASSFIIMAIVGGAIMPFIMGVLADNYSTAISYIIPLGCFVVVAWFGSKGSKIETR